MFLGYSTPSVVAPQHLLPAGELSPEHFVAPANVVPHFATINEPLRVVLVMGLFIVVDAAIAEGVALFMASHAEVVNARLELPVVVCMDPMAVLAFGALGILTERRALQVAALVTFVPACLAVEVLLVCLAE